MQLSTLIINTLYTRFCTSYIGITYKFLYKQSLYSEIPAVYNTLHFLISYQRLVWSLLARGNFFENSYQNCCCSSHQLQWCLSLLRIFHCGEKQNTSHWKAHCKGCGSTDLTLATLLGGQKEWLSHLLPREINIEAELMQALAELPVDEDENPDDDDAIESPSKDKYKG